MISLRGISDKLYKQNLDMGTKITDTKETSNELYKLLGTGLVWYDGRYWLAETYNPKLYGGGWFASPIYGTNDELEVRPAGGNWCYKNNGAIEATDLTTDQKKQIYDSWIKHLNWVCGHIQKYPNDLKMYNEKIDYFKALRKDCA
ncbi:MAG: hypothetical protein PSN34_09120 [Urechidicola sp.]|nr:hypothetical protein [Urechidicola sp.]